MVNAVMADRQFVAEKQNVVIIDETPQAVRGGYVGAILPQQLLTFAP